MLHIHHHAAGRMRAERLAARFGLVRQDVLHAHVDGELHRVAGLAAAQPGIETQLEAGHAFAVAVGIGDAQHLRGGAAVGIVALAARLELEARQAQMHHPVLRVGRELARDRHIGMLGR